MTILRKTIFVLMYIAVLVAAMSFVPIPAKGKVSIRFEHFVGDACLQLDAGKYQNALGQSYTVSKFRYYVSNIRLIRREGKAFQSKGYYLVDEEAPDSKKILLPDVPDGEFTGMEFTLGVDSARNCSGLQTGALDPVNGMFWAWNTGYVFMKMEGNSPVSKSPGNMLEFHVGGYREPVNCIRRIHLDFGGNNIKTAKGKTPVIRIKTNVAEIFTSPADIDFSKLSSVTDLHNASLLANNYADMFSIIETGNN